MLAVKVLTKICMAKTGVDIAIHMAKAKTTAKKTAHCFLHIPIPLIIRRKPAYAPPCARPACVSTVTAGLGLPAGGKSRGGQQAAEL